MKKSFKVPSSNNVKDVVEWQEAMRNTYESSDTAGKAEVVQSMREGGLTQKQVAVCLKKSQARISQVENSVGSSRPRLPVTRPPLPRGGQGGVAIFRAVFFEASFVRCEVEALKA